MTAELGSFALVLALVLSLAQIGLSVAGRLRGSAVLSGAGEGAAAGAFLGVAFAFAALMLAFITSDFSVVNVAENSHTAKPLLYKIAGVWGNHDGSMLLWCLALTGFGSVIALGGGGLPARLKATAVASQGVLGALFLAYTVFASNPLLRLAHPPVEGASLNPVLQDPFLAIHPPFLYAGYVGMSVVYSLAVAALIEGRIDAAWARWVRPWALASWSLLTIGITLGSFWAYYELGWGGWWAWDPVENASFMPWLAATALLHSAVVTEKRGALAAWTVFLALMAFTFSMLGAFLVRSGVLMSVHAFAVNPKRGMLLLAILGIASGSGFGLFAWRAPSLPPGGLFAPISRETALVINNLFISAAAVTVLLGTLYPLIRQALTGDLASFGGPYYYLTFVPLMAMVLLILPIGPLLAWKRGDLLGALQRLWVAGLVALGAGGLVLAINQPHKALAAFGVGLGVWLICGSIAELADRGRAGKTPPGEVLRRLGRLPRGAWGMTLAHIGIGVFVMGAAFETAWRVEAAKVMGVGDQMALGAFQLNLDSVGPLDGPNYSAERAVITVTKAGQEICRASPARRFYPVQRETTSKVAICPPGVSDIYIVLGERRAGPAGQPVWLVRAYWNRWSRLIFFGPLLMALGGVISLSDRRFALWPAAKGRPPGDGAGGVRVRAALAALAAVFCLAAAADPGDRLADPGQEARARALFEQIRCVVCQNESIDDSEADLARDLRQTVRGQIAAGQSDAQIRGFLTQRYGEFILLRPRFSAANAVAWLAPFAIVLAGAVVLLARVARPAPPGGDPLTPEEEGRLAQLRDG